MVKRNSSRESFLDKARLPRRAGFLKKVQFRNNTKKSKFTMRRYRTHYRLMFTLEGRFIRRSIKGLRSPDSYDKNNQHGGVMPALPGDFTLSDRQAGTLFQRIAQRQEEISYDQLRGVSGCLSYLYSLKNGVSGTNFKSVKKVLEGWFPSDYGQSKELKPTSIPTPNLTVHGFAQ